MTKCFHGTRVVGEAREGVWMDGLPAVLSSLNHSGLFYVTNSEKLATRYANAQATREVNPSAFDLLPGAAVVEFEYAGKVKWSRRPKSHQTLDLVEAMITDTEKLRPMRIIACMEKWWCEHIDRVPALVAAIAIAEANNIEFELRCAK